jgi:glycogen debranching enzyme
MLASTSCPSVPLPDSEARKWLGDDLLFPHHKDVVMRCLEWIDHYGDRDGDGFQEYQTQSAHGYENMGWKDAAIRWSIRTVPS